MRLRPALLAASALLAVPLRAQDRPTGLARVTNLGFDLHALVARPIGPFDQYVNAGVGVGGAGRWFPGGQRVLALRGELGWLIYGRQTVREPFGTSGRITVDITTSNNIVMGTIGPELAVPAGPVRPYVNASYGFSSFWTQSSARGTQPGSEEVFQTTNLRDNIASGALGAGVRFPISDQLGIDLGARRWYNGNARYYTRQSFGTGLTPTTPRAFESDTDMWTVHIGVTLGR